MKKKRFLGFVLTLALVLWLLPGMSLTALADGEWTEVGTADALQAAVNESKTNIKLTAGIDVSSFSSDWGLDVSGKNLTLDLNGYTLSSTSKYSVISTDNGTNLTIEDSSTNRTGAIANSSYYGIYQGNGTVNITGGTVSGSWASICADAGALNVSGGTIAGNQFGIYAEGTTTVNISGGKINAKMTGVIAPSEEGNSPTIKVSGGYITDGNYGIITQSGTVEVSNNGFVYGKKRGISAENSVSAVTITGGAVGGGEGGLVVAKSASPSVTISNGLLWHHSEVSENGYALELSNAGGQGVISGGNFRGTVRVGAEGSDPLNNVTITGGCFEKNFNTANNSKPIIEGGEFWGRITTANSGPIIKGGVYAFESESYNAKEVIKSYLAESYSLVNLIDATYKEGKVSGEYKYGVVATPTLNITPESATKTYDGTGVTLTAEPSASTAQTKGATAENTYNISWAYQWTKGEDTSPLGTEASYTTGANVSDSGTYKCTLKSGDNVVNSGTKQVTIAKANAVAATIAANNRTYDDTEKPLVNVTGTATGGEMQYVTGTDATNAPTSGWDTSIPKGINAGTYYVWYKVVGDKNHKDSEPACVTVKIAEKPAVSAAKPVLAAKAIAKGKTAAKLSWSKVSGAASYEVWLAKCGKKSKTRKVKILGASETSWTKKKLKRRTAYKFYVVAKDAEGKVISRSLTGHFISGNVNGRYTNAKSLKLGASSAELKKGETFRITAKQTKAKEGMKLLKHAALLRYVSDDTSVATVDSKGIVTGVKAGSCRVYVFTVNGISKTMAVTVK